MAEPKYDRCVVFGGFLTATFCRRGGLEAKMGAPQSDDASFLPAVREMSERAADLLVREVLDWRVLFLDRPPEVGP